MPGRARDRQWFEVGVPQRFFRPELVSCERRNKSRYPIELSIRYKIHEGRRIIQAGVGTTINLSSEGILLRSDHLLPARSKVHVSIDWPFSLNRACGLQLIAFGKVLRSDQRGTAMQIARYEFRTCARSETAASNSSALGRAEGAELYARD